MTDEHSANEAAIVVRGRVKNLSRFGGCRDGWSCASALVLLFGVAALLLAAAAPCAAGSKTSTSRFGRGRAKVAAPRLLGRRKAQRGLKAARGALGERYRQKRQARRQAFGRQALRSVGALPAVGLPGPPRPDAPGRPPERRWRRSGFSTTMRSIPV